MDKKALEKFISDFYQAWKNRDETKIPSFYDPNLRAYSDFSEISLDDILNRLEFSKQNLPKLIIILKTNLLMKPRAR